MLLDIAIVNQSIPRWALWWISTNRFFWRFSIVWFLWYFDVEIERSFPQSDLWWISKVRIANIPTVRLENNFKGDIVGEFQRLYRRGVTKVRFVKNSHKFGLKMHTDCYFLILWNVSRPWKKNKCVELHTRKKCRSWMHRILL